MFGVAWWCDLTLNGVRVRERNMIFFRVFIRALMINPASGDVGSFVWQPFVKISEKHTLFSFY